ETFGESNVGLLTGDSVVSRDAQILIMTTEVLRNMLYQRGSNTLQSWLMCFYDELHVIFCEAFPIDGFIVATIVQTKLGAFESCNGKAKVDIEPDQEREVGQYTSGTCGQFGLATSIKSDITNSVFDWTHKKDMDHMGSISQLEK
ncbi:hypothetical protein IFM89_028340, partial [Coptis chinensis]